MSNNIQTAQSIANRIQSGDTNLGRVSMETRDDYSLLNYTREAMFRGNMTPVEQTCRGLVVRGNGKIMALPMPKFFNIGEPQCPPLPGEPYTIWEKLDGSLTIFWHDNERWHCNTRGSFQNEYTEFASGWWADHIDIEHIPEHWTIMAEACFDNDPNPRAAYTPEGLYLIAIRDRYSGADIPTDSVDFWNPQFIPKIFPGVKIDALLEKKQNIEGTEGWVIRFESGLRVKVKTAWYLRLFRAISDLAPKHIRELMVEAGEDWINTFPDDLQPEATAIQEIIECDFQTLLSRIYYAYSRVAHIEARKDYALTVLQKYPDISHWLFNLRDNRFEEIDVLRNLPI